MFHMYQPTFLSPASFASSRAFFKSSKASALFLPPGPARNQPLASNKEKKISGFHHQLRQSETLHPSEPRLL